jgi:hypothetical protein
LKMTIEIVDFPIKNGGSFHSYVSHYQRVPPGHIFLQTTSDISSKLFPTDGITKAQRHRSISQCFANAGYVGI